MIITEFNFSNVFVDFIKGLTLSILLFLIYAFNFQIFYMKWLRQMLDVYIFFYFPYVEKFKKMALIVDIILKDETINMESISIHLKNNSIDLFVY